MKRSSNKRTQALKQILNGSTENSIANIKEDLIEDQTHPKHLEADTNTNTYSNTTDTSACSNTKIVTFGGDASNQESQVAKEPNEKVSAPSELSQSIEVFYRLIDKELAKAANLLEIDELELKAWVDLQIEVPAKTILHLLRTMQSLHLDPLNEEIGFTQYEDGIWQVFITIEGCSKLLNQHSQFNGLTFNQSDTLINGIPEWIECSIYRRDRILPITVREHLIEVRGENAIWQKMPRRMLRHRALQQCVRLAIA